ncbi:MAG: FHA domain-containing protein [Gemmataceae bacterium]|nr:FHA domain-containing protein [Gemmataceae bacterium]
MGRGTVTFQVLEGIDKGRIFRDLPLPVTMGREEGNVLRLNDERVSRFHAKIQTDDEDHILTDLESTNGTRVNGTVVQIRRLRFGDRVSIGRSILLYGSNEEIAARMAAIDKGELPPLTSLSQVTGADPQGTIQATTKAVSPEGVEVNLDFELRLEEPIKSTRDALFIGNRMLPPLPMKLTASQAARLAEILDFLHLGLTEATENIQAKDDGSQVTLGYHDWQRIQAVQMLLARYHRLIAEPNNPFE